MASFQQTIQQAQLFQQQQMGMMNQERIIAAHQQQQQRNKDEQIAELLLENELKNHEIADLKKQLEDAKNQVQRLSQQVTQLQQQQQEQQQEQQQQRKKPPPAPLPQPPSPPPDMIDLDDVLLPNNILQDNGLPQTSNKKKRLAAAPHVDDDPHHHQQQQQQEQANKKPKMGTTTSWQAVYEDVVHCRKTCGWSTQRLKEERPDLYEWQCEQRDILNGKGKKTTTTTSDADDDDVLVNSLTPEQVTKLRVIGLKVDSRPRKKGVQRKHTPWEERFAQLQEFAQLYGHTRVTKVEHNMPLWNWVGTMRKAYKKQRQQEAGRGGGGDYDNNNNNKKTVLLTPDRVAKLESIGFEWEIKKWGGTADTWEQRYQELLQYQAKYGATYIPLRSDDKHIQLYNWCKFQRTKYNKIQNGQQRSAGLLTEERVARLRAIGFPWHWQE